MEQLGRHYDRIIIDSAPTQAVSDALVISRLCDSVVYCVKSHFTSMDLIRRGLQRLRQVDAPIAGVVITQVDVDKIQAYGGDYYYQGYYDYYGYNEKGSGTDKKGGRLRLTQDELHAIRTDDREVDLGLEFANSDRANDTDGLELDDLDITAELDFDLTEHMSRDDLNDVSKKVEML